MAGNHCRGGAASKRWPLLSRMAQNLEISAEAALRPGAMVELTDPEEIRQFMIEYADWLRWMNGGDEKGEETAWRNVGYLIGYFNAEVRQRWLDALPNLSHPVFGRDLNVSPDEAFQAGYRIGQMQRVQRTFQQRQPKKGYW